MEWSVVVGVKVWQPVDYDADLVAAAIGEDPLPIRADDRVLAPFITVDGRVHTTTSNFLRHHCLGRPNLATATRIASDLAGWVDFLVNRRHLHPHEDSRDPVLLATEDDFAAYYRLRQYGTPAEALTSDGWRRAGSAIKRLYEYLQRQYQHKPPFDLVTVGQSGQWTGTTIAKYAPRRRNTGSAGTPLTPEFAHLLLMGALRVDVHGHQDTYRGADRDHGIIALGLATGLRRNNLANITVYELPRPSSLPITTMRVADQITKGDAGGDALVFSHYLPAVWDYVEGARAEVADRSQYRPRRPLHILEADSVAVRYHDPEQPGQALSRRWTQCDESLRRRLVTPDGSSPIVFLNELNGRPLAYRSLQHAIEGAQEFVRARLEPDFPQHFRLHDLRHTYAVHLTVAIYRDVITDALPAHRREEWKVDHIAAAVELVKFSLGHASEASTRLYIQTAHRFLAIPTEHFLGRI
jgi:integrase